MLHCHKNQPTSSKVMLRVERFYGRLRKLRRILLILTATENDIEFLAMIKTSLNYKLIPFRF
jgi:hypothetical protein